MDKGFMELVDFSDEVRTGRDAGRALVALESTIVTHGMPWPDNARMARQVEAIIRGEGAVPATIAVLDGRLKVGLSTDELERLARVREPMKLSRADLAFALAEGRSGGTTVAATMIVAHYAGIRVFATGGIGGVHKGAEMSFDVSADLEELARTPVIVVCAGAKAILDLDKTLEVLETKGVPVVGFGTDVLPAFWSRGSHLNVPLRLDEPGAIARFQAAREMLGLDGGVLVTNPVPAEFEIPATVMAGHIEQAQAAALREGITGKAVTPFLLAEILRTTGGESLKANIALVENNARLAARIAMSLVRS